MVENCIPMKIFTNFDLMLMLSYLSRMPAKAYDSNEDIKNERKFCIVDFTFEKLCVEVVIDH